MSDKTDEAFEAWLRGKVRTVGIGDAFRAGATWKQQQDLAAVGQVMQYSGTGDHQVAFLKACTMLAERIKGAE